MNKTITKTALALAVVGGGVMSATQAQAAVLIEVSQGGGNVQFTLSGTLDVSGLTPDLTDTFGFPVPGSAPNAGLSFFNENPATVVDFYFDSIDSPGNLVFGAGGAEADAVTGNFFLDGVGAFGPAPFVAVPTGYAGEQLSATMTFSNTSFADLGIVAGTYTSGFNGGADTITYRVPEPLTILGTGVALGFGALLKRKKNSNA